MVSTHSWEACARLCVYVCVSTHMQVRAGQSSAQVLLGQDGCSGDGRRKGRAHQRGPGTGRRADTAGNANPKALFCFEFLQRQHLHWALFMGHGVNASLGADPSTLLCCRALLTSLGPGQQRSRMESQEPSSNDSPCC